MLSFLVFLFIVGVVIIVHEFGHFIVAKSLKVGVEEYYLGFGPRLYRKRRNNTDYGVNLIPLGGYVKLAGDNLEEFKGKRDEYLSQSPGRRAMIVFCGPFFNYLLGFLCFWFIFFAFATPMLTTKVGELIDGFGAQQAGMRVGDTIVSIDGKKVTFWEDIQRLIQNKKPGEKAEVSFLRENKFHNLKVMMKGEAIEDALGQKRKRSLLGIKPAEEIIDTRHGFAKSFILAANKTWNLTAMTYRALWLMVTGRLSLRDSLAGPLGFLHITSVYAKQGVVAILHLLGILSVNLCIFNLLPLPVLDGGHIVLLAVEKARGKYLSRGAEAIINRIGLSMIIFLALVATGIDLMRFFEDKSFMKWLGR